MSTLSSTIPFLMISDFIVVHFTFTKNVSGKLKTQFQVIFWSGFLSSENESISGQSFAELFELSPR